MIQETDVCMIRELDEYKPKNFMFTSNEEKKYIEETLHIKERDILSLLNLRNCVVMHYSLREADNKHAPFESLMSITAVIDLAIAEKVGEA